MATASRQSSSRKYFSVQQANATLPLVRVIIRDIVDLARQVHDRQQRIERLLPRTGVGGLTEELGEELRDMRRQMLRDKQQMQGYATELAQLGVELKDRLLGLVDFPSLEDDREVCLCWMYGEPEVQHWHEREDGFAGRKCLKPVGRD